MTRPLPFSGRVRAYAAWSVVAGGPATLAVSTGRIERWQAALLLAAYLGGVALLC